MKVNRWVNKIPEHEREYHKEIRKALGNRQYIKFVYEISLIKKKASRLMSLSPGIGYWGALMMAENYYKNRKI
jgi:hypothetical protein